MQDPTSITVVSHPRSGTHFLARSLFGRFQTPFNDYRDLIGTHALELAPARARQRQLNPHAPPPTILYLRRDPLAVMLSLFRLRDFFAIDRAVTFSDFLRTRYADFPFSTSCAVDFVHPVAPEHLTQPRPALRARAATRTPLEHWLDAERFWPAHAAIIADYDAFAADPHPTLSAVAALTRWPVVGPPHHPDHLGFTPAHREPVTPSPDDLALIDTFRSASPFRATPSLQHHHA